MTGIVIAEVDRNGLEILSREDCLRLLASATLGRVGITFGALPTILPINFRLVGERIVFRTGVGTKLDAGTSNAIVAFEVDDIDPFSHTGWSVVVIGEAGEVTDPDDLTELMKANIPRWAPSGDDRIVSVSTPMISGRRLVPGLRAPHQD
jgi:nitroimidazol reductase NimA-like FMN-containing flavoprotein (pyridoxamine 5'-phosphate oxidase superfamily)